MSLPGEAGGTCCSAVSVSPRVDQLSLQKLSGVDSFLEVWITRRESVDQSKSLGGCAEGLRQGVVQWLLTEIQKSWRWPYMAIATSALTRTP